MEKKIGKVTLLLIFITSTLLNAQVELVSYSFCKNLAFVDSIRYDQIKKFKTVKYDTVYLDKIDTGFVPIKAIIKGQLSFYNKQFKTSLFSKVDSVNCFTLCGKNGNDSTLLYKTGVYELAFLKTETALAIEKKILLSKKKYFSGKARIFFRAIRMNNTIFIIQSTFEENKLPDEFLTYIKQNF